MLSKSHPVTPKSHRPAKPRLLGYCSALAIVLIPVSQMQARAQNASPAERYTLERTIKEALEASTDIQTATRIVQVDRKQAEAELARLKPSLQLDANAARYDGDTVISISGVPPITVLKDHSETVTLGASLDLDVFGQVRRAASQSTLQSLADQMNLVSIRNARILYAANVYYTLLRSEHQVEVAQAALTTARQQQATALKLNLGQVGQKIDVLRANTQVADSEQELTSARNNLAIAHNNFNDLVGRALDMPLQAEDVPGVTVGVAITTEKKNDDKSSTPPFEVSIDSTDHLDVAGSVRGALQRRPEVLAAQIQVRSAETGIKLARGGLDPTLSLSAGGNYYPTTSFQSPRQSTAEIGINFSIPLYDSGATRARVESARLQSDNAKSILDRRRKDVALEVRQAYLNLAASARQIGTANTGLTQAIAARRLAQARYEGQVGLYLEITDAQSALIQAETSQVNAVYGYLIARAQFENAIGAPAMK